MKKTKETKVIEFYRNRAGVEFRPGDEVRLKRGTIQSPEIAPPEFAGRKITKARITGLFQDVRGGVQLETKLGGYWCWNVEDLEKVQ